MFSAGELPKTGGGVPKKMCVAIEGNTLRKIADELGISHADIQKSNHTLNDQFGLDGILPRGEEVNIGIKFHCPGIFRHVDGREAYANLVTVGKNGSGEAIKTTISDLERSTPTASKPIDDGGGIDE